MPALEAVGKRYGRAPAVLTDVTFAARPGAVAAVVGGNGSGKSTLLRILAAVSRPTSGRRTGEAVGHHVVTGYAVALGAVAEFACACVDIGLGLLCSRLVVPRPGFSMLLGLTLVLSALVLPWLPTAPMLRAMSADHHGGRAVPFAVEALLGVAVLAVATAVTQAVGMRRD